MIETALLDTVKNAIKAIANIDSKPIFAAYSVDDDTEHANILDGKKFPGCAILLDIGDLESADTQFDVIDIPITIAVMIYTTTRKAAITRSTKVIKAVNNLTVPMDANYTFQPTSEITYKSGPQTIYATKDEYGVRIDFKIYAQVNP